MVKRDRLRWCRGGAALAAALAACISCGGCAAPLSSFAPPANLEDFAGKEKQREEFMELWSANIDQWTEQAILGDPWTVQNDRDRVLYYNPLKTVVPADATKILVSWFPFPNRLRAYFGKQFTADELYELADNGKLADGRGIPDLPSEVCPQVNPASKPRPFFPAGARGWQDEYMEWSVQRDPATNKILRVMFTSENPDYWHALWNVDPDEVTELYRSLLHMPSIQKEDLYLRYEGKVVIDPVTSRPAYDMLNKWNRGTKTLPDGGGAVHLTSAPNTLRAEIYLAAAATLLRTDDRTAQDLTCASQFGQNFRNSDPHIGFEVNQLVKNRNTRISLTDPVGLYIQDPDFTHWKLPKEAPAGVSAAQLWKVVRGKAGGTTTLAVLEVPAEYGFTVSDILIEGRPIRWASQVAETVKIGLSVTTFASKLPPQAQQPKVKDSEAPLAQPILIAGYDALRAAPTVDRDSPWFAPTVKRGHTVRGLGLAVRAAKEKPTIAFSGDGVTVTVTGTSTVNSPTDGLVTLYAIDVAVAADATLGKRDVTVTSPGQPAGLPARGFLVVAR